MAPGAALCPDPRSLRRFAYLVSGSRKPSPASSSLWPPFPKPLAKPPLSSSIVRARDDPRLQLAESRRLG